MKRTKKKESAKVIAKSTELPPVEELIDFPSLSSKLPGKPSISTLWSWTNKGRKSIRGECVRMKSWLGTNGRVSTVDAYREFLERLNDL